MKQISLLPPMSNVIQLRNSCVRILLSSPIGWIIKASQWEHDAHPGFLICRMWSDLVTTPATLSYWLDSQPIVTPRLSWISYLQDVECFGDDTCYSPPTVLAR